MTLTVPEAATALSSLVSLSLLWGLNYWFWAEYRIDRFRQALFVLRAELFDIARAGQISFSDPAYTHLRATLNGFLRFAENLGFFALILQARTAARHPECGERVARVEEAWQKAVGSLRPEVRNSLLGIRTRMHFAVFTKVLFSSPLFSLTMLPLLAFLFARYAGGHLLRSLYKQGLRVANRYVFRPLDAIAFSEAPPELSASTSGSHSLTFA